MSKRLMCGCFDECCTHGSLCHCLACQIQPPCDACDGDCGWNPDDPTDPCNPGGDER